MSDLPIVCVFGVDSINLKSESMVPKFETNELDCRCYKIDTNLYSILAKDNPISIVTIGDITLFKNLQEAPWEVRKMWLHFNDISNLDAIGNAVFNCCVTNMLAKRNDYPLISIFTPAYKSGDKILRPFNSLLKQTYNNWEWIIVDDSDDDDSTFIKLSRLAKQDHRIKLFKQHKHSGNIGHLKRIACGFANGDYLLELDHDDELTTNALQDVIDTFDKYPDAGFVYSDCAEIYESRCNCGIKPVMYNPGWGMGYGSYYDHQYNGQTYKVGKAMNINPKTIRHIVGVPNHYRCWKKSVYEKIGGHKDLVHVADDYEIIVRTFLTTQMVRIPKMGYIQYYNVSGNTHKVRNAEIQRLVRYFSQYYDKLIHKRFIELGIDDYVYGENGSQFFNIGNTPNPITEQYANIIADL